MVISRAIGVAFFPDREARGDRTELLENIRAGDRSCPSPMVVAEEIHHWGPSDAGSFRPRVLLQLEEKRTHASVG